MTTIHYLKVKKGSFSSILKRRVNDYFKNNDISKRGNQALVFKTFFMFTLYLVPYFLILFNSYSSWVLLLLVVLIGVGKAGVALSVTHDANHGAYSNHKFINTILGYSLDFIGGSSFIWKIKHNIFHHTHTNVFGHDEDIHEGFFFFRFSPHSEKFMWHQYQYLYAPFLYCLATLKTLVAADFIRLKEYSKSGLLKKLGYNTKREALFMIFSKSFYLFYMLIIPYWFTDFTIIQLLIGFFIIHAITSIILIISFVAGHIVEESLFPLPNLSNEIDKEWYEHQLFVTANFAMKNRVLTWFIGGLNYQIEHHLFPHISHVHYPAISRIVKETAAEFKIPYYAYNSVKDILKSHLRLLKELGK